MEKSTQLKNSERILYSSQEKKCVSFKPVEGFQKVVFGSREELMNAIHLLLDSGYKVQ